MTVLILTHPLDLTADLVITVLVEQGTPVARFDLAQFPQDLTLDARLVDGRWIGCLADGHRRVDLDEVTAVYYRRPSPFGLPPMSESERVWAADEARHGVGGVLASLPCRWVNHPGRNAATSYKPVQLTTAVTCGLDVPSSLITNDPGVARQFVITAADGAVYKPLYGSPAEPGWTMFTTRVTADQLGPPVAATAHTFQAYVPKSHEVRLTVVGDRLFPARIDAGSAAAELDWRTDYDALAYEPAESRTTSRLPYAGSRRRWACVSRRWTSSLPQTTGGSSWKSTRMASGPGSSEPPGFPSPPPSLRNYQRREPLHD